MEKSGSTGGMGGEWVVPWRVKIVQVWMYQVGGAERQPGDDGR